MKEFFSNWAFLGYLLVPASISADNTPLAIDTKGYNSVAVALGVGVGGITFDATNKIEFKLRHADVSDLSDVAALTADDIIADSYAPTTITTGIVRSLTAAHAASTLQRIGYIGKSRKRYLSMLADFSGTHGTATPIMAAVFGMHPWLAPVT